MVRDAVPRRAAVDVPPIADVRASWRRAVSDSVSEAALCCAGCHHDSCTWGWKELRAKYDSSQQSTAKGKGTNPSASRAREIAPYTPFPVKALPAVVADYVSAAAAAIGCDLAFIAMPLLACLARAIGNNRVIRLKDTWTEFAILWAAIVGKSGTHKTPAIQAAMHHLQRKQSTAITEYQAALAKYKEDLAIYERDHTKHGNSPTKKKPSHPRNRRKSRFANGTLPSIPRLKRSPQS